jgi:steroid delta-isomerase-like uncharacterized protein
MRKRSSSRHVALGALAVVWACSGPAVDAPAVERNVAMIQAYVEAANRGDASYLDEYLAPGYAYHGPAGELDRSGFMEFHEGVLAAFPEATMTAEDVIAEGDRVATRWTLRGAHRGPFLGIPPTGKEVTISGIIISRFQDGRVVEEWEVADRLGLMQQLGVLPTQEGPGATAGKPNRGSARSGDSASRSSTPSRLNQNVVPAS